MRMPLACRQWCSRHGDAGMISCRRSTHVLGPVPSGLKDERLTAISSRWTISTTPLGKPLISSGLANPLRCRRATGADVVEWAAQVVPALRRRGSGTGGTRTADRRCPRTPPRSRGHGTKVNDVRAWRDGSQALQEFMRGEERGGRAKRRADFERLLGSVALGEVGLDPQSRALAAAADRQGLLSARGALPALRDAAGRRRDPLRHQSHGRPVVLGSRRRSASSSSGAAPAPPPGQGAQSPAGGLYPRLPPGYVWAAPETIAKDPTGASRGDRARLREFERRRAFARPSSGSATTTWRCR